MAGHAEREAAGAAGVWAEPGRIRHAVGLFGTTQQLDALRHSATTPQCGLHAGSVAAGGRAPDVNDSMVWIPLVTYLQVAFDMFTGEAVPARPQLR